MTSRTKRIFALIIGIDEYLDPTIRRLRGAVADADSFAEYLTTRLDVPIERIRNLRNGQATRNAIKHELISLKINDKIKKDDPILIFFAGHGNDAPAPPEWSNWGSNVQSLTPHDYGQRDYEGGIVQGLPDRTLGTILKELADAKGNNITVILDCCHSGSGTRSIDPSVRCAPTAAHLIPADLDSDVIPITRGVTELPKFRHQGLQSHVLLAACLPEELAHELQTQGRGAFTYALLNALYLLDSVDTTYADLMRRLTHLPRQNPQCEGNSNRMLFSNIVRSMKGCYIAKLEKDKLVIEAGIINGVTSATVFDLWLKIDDVFGTPLTTLPEKGLCKPFPLRTEVKSPSLKHHNVPGTNFIVKPRNTEKPTLAVHVEDNAKLIFRSLCEHPNALATFVLEEKPKGLADVGLSGHRESISFHLLASEESRFQCPPRQIGIENVWDYLSHAAFYYQRLRQVNGATQEILPGSKPANPPKPFISMFDIRVYQLEEDKRYGNYHPCGDPLNTREGVHLMLEDGQGDGQEAYGFEIVNNSSFDVYPYLFYFNSYELSIQSLYKPVVLAQRPTPPLKKGQALTIGWGPGGVEPPGFSVGDDTDVENGFLKLYITQKPVELGFLAQGSIGEAHRGMKTLSREPMGQLWGSVKIPFVLQRKRNAASEEAPFLCLLGTKNAKISFMKTISPLYRAKSTTSVGPSIEHHDFTLEDGSRLTLIDLPALDTRDLHKSGKVCHDILDYFREHGTYSVHSFIFAYDISKPWTRVQFLDTLNLELVRDICGDQSFPAITLVTTNWDLSHSQSHSAAETREEYLRESERLFKPFLGGGAQLVRSTDVTSLTDLVQGRQSGLLGVQDEVQRGIQGTSVFRTLKRRVENELKELKGELDAVHEEMNAESGGGVWSHRQESENIQKLRREKERIESEMKRLREMMEGFEDDPAHGVLN